MREKFQNKYRIATARKSNWDYRWAGAYFITICTRDKEPFFGHIEGGKMHLSPAGILANVFWYEIGSRNKNISLGQFIVMPDHIHGILILESGLVVPDNTLIVPEAAGAKHEQEGETRHEQHEDETRHALSLRDLWDVETGEVKTHRQLRYRNPGQQSVSSILGSYKSAVTKHANRLQIPHGWQPRFHDRIIQNQTEFNNASNYIRTNVSRYKPL